MWLAKAPEGKDTKTNCPDVKTRDLPLRGRRVTSMTFSPRGRTAVAA
jgi:hypothetical protein